MTFPKAAERGSPTPTRRELRPLVRRFRHQGPYGLPKAELDAVEVHLEDVEIRDAVLHGTAEAAGLWRQVLRDAHLRPTKAATS